MAALACGARRQMLKTVLRFACTGALAASFATAIWPQTSEWQIDSSHSTASFSLLNANDPDRSYNAAIAKVAGRIDLDPNKSTESTLRLNIYPGGEGENLLDRHGNFHTGAHADLAKYSLLSFQSKHSKLTPDGKIEFQGDLTLIRVERRVVMNWSNAYMGSVEEQPVTDEVTHEATILVDPKALVEATASKRTSAEVAALAVIDRAGFEELWGAIRDSVWPLVVLDRDCRMAYYSGPSMRDYSGATCTGTPVTVAPYDSSYPYAPPRFNDIGAGFTKPPSGNQVAIAADLHLAQTTSNTSGHSGIDSKTPSPNR
jgi:polyisoprenoid-binding protein YceI